MPTATQHSLLRAPGTKAPSLHGGTPQAQPLAVLSPKALCGMSDAELLAYRLHCAERMRACHHHDADESHRWFRLLADAALEQDRRPLSFHQGVKQ